MIRASYTVTGDCIVKGASEDLEVKSGLGYIVRLCPQITLTELDPLELHSTEALFTSTSVPLGVVKLRAGEMYQQLRTLAALKEDPSLISRTHVRRLATTCNSSSK